MPVPVPVPVAVMLSFRLGGADGVSIEAAKWAHALRTLGFAVHRIAGEFGTVEPGRVHDVVLPGLAIDAGTPVSAPALTAALDGVDLVVVENLLSLPMNLDAARVVTSTLHGFPGQVVLHHHDLAWQREQYRAITELPPELPGAVHVAINDHSRRELANRGFAAVTVRNHFDLTAPHGDRTRARAALGVSDATIVVFQPTRAIARKNVPAAVALAEALGELTGRPVLYWLSGPAEDGYAPTLETILAETTVPVRRGLWRPRARSEVGAEVGPHDGPHGGPHGGLEIADAYAACDVVAFPSTWEGFGNPVIESIVAGRPLAAGSYPALDELRALGIGWLPIDDPAAIASAIEHPDPDAIMANRLAVARHLDLADLPRHLAELLDRRG